MAEVVIALVGPPAAGKSMFVKIVQQLCGPPRVVHCSTGDIVRRILRGVKLPQDRPSCATLVEVLVQELGPGLFSSAIKHRIDTSLEPIFIVDSMRLLTDEEVIDGLPGRVLKVYITAPPEIRHRRLSERKRDGEEQLSLEQFLRDDQLPTERLIHEIGRRADFKFVTGDDYAKNDAEQLAFCQSHLAQYRVG